jgi:Flp pilus assembly pilin Flp
LAGANLWLPNIITRYKKLDRRENIGYDKTGYRRGGSTPRWFLKEENVCIFIVSVEFMMLGGGIMRKWLRRIQKFLLDKDGQGLTEYAFILILVSIVSVAILTTLGGDIKTLLDMVIPLGSGS